jgi:heme oxygenase (biliverdin-IX-beta and delta-forming)
MSVRAGQRLTERLRLETGAAHRAVERRLLQEGWLDDRDAYTTLVGRLFALHVQIEAETLRLAAELECFDSEVRTHSGLLAGDLTALGVAGSERGESTPPLQFSDAGGLLGGLYVVEGSTLGGQVISRLLAARLGLSADTGASGFDPYGARTIDHWERFKRSLDAWPGDPAQVVVGAHSMFACWDSWVLRPRSQSAMVGCQ